MENGLITDAFITSSSHAKWYEPFHARLNHQSAWCKNLSEPSASYIQINTNATHLICAIATQGTANNSYPSFVKEYKLEISFDGARWDFYQGSNGTEVHESHLFFVRASLCMYIYIYIYVCVCVLFLNVKNRRGTPWSTIDCTDCSVTSRVVVMVQWLAHLTCIQGTRVPFPLTA